MLQCLVVAVRPLYVKELAELLAFEFNAVQGGIPKYRPAWRLDDQTQAVLSTCSSLVTIIDTWNGRQVVQFSHFSVKEFLMSNRLTSSLGDFSGYQIHPGPAHTILTQACLGLLLHLDHPIGEESIDAFPLAGYAAEYWVDHAQFEDVASHVKDGMETLFDSDKPHFGAWIVIYDNYWHDEGTEELPNPLYYAAYCGFYDLVKHLAVKHPQHVNAISGQYSFPLLAALSEGHVEVAELLLEHGANVDVRNTTGETILLIAFLESQNNLVDVVRFLLKPGADVNARDDTLGSSLHLGFSNLEVAQVLLEYNADVNSQDHNGRTPLHMLYAWNDNEDFVLNCTLLLLKHGADVNKRDEGNQAPLNLAIQRYMLKVAGSLVAHGAEVNSEDNNGKTPLHLLSERWPIKEGNVLNLMSLLLKHGAEVNKRDKDNQTPLHLAIRPDMLKVAGSLVAHGADVNSEDSDGKTPLRILLESPIIDEGSVLNLAVLLLKHGAEANRRLIDEDDEIPLHLAMRWAQFKLARVILESGTYDNAWDNHSKTTLRILSESRIYDENGFVNHALLLLKHGVNQRVEDNKTQSLLGIGRGKHEFTRLLLSIPQMLPRIIKWGRPHCKKYHEGNTTPGSVV